MLKSSEDARPEALDLLDLASSAHVDRITRTTVQLSDLAIPAVFSTIGDRQWFRPDPTDDDGTTGQGGLGIRLHAGSIPHHLDGECLGASCMPDTDPPAGAGTPLSLPTDTDGPIACWLAYCGLRPVHRPSARGALASARHGAVPN